MKFKNYIGRYVLCILTAGLITLGTTGRAQNRMDETPPTPFPVELMFGNEEVNLLAVFQAGFQKGQKFRFFNITTGLIDYDNRMNEVVTVNQLAFNLNKSIAATGGFQFHSVKGFVPLAGLRLSYADSTWFLVASPSVLFRPSLNAEAVVFLEYKPFINKKLNVYSRIQLLYDYSIECNRHDRSYAYFRMGLSRRNYSFGLGLNFDFFGPDSTRDENYGLFFQYRLFWITDFLLDSPSYRQNNAKAFSRVIIVPT